MRYLPAFLRIFTSTPELPYASMSLANHRRLMTVLCICLEIECDLTEQASLDIIQGAVDLLQRQVYKRKGAVVGIAYEGGITRAGGHVGLELVASWGEHSLNRHDASSLALLAAMSIQSAMRMFLLEMSNNTFSIRQSRKSLIRMGSSVLGGTEDGTTIEGIELPLHCGLATGWIVQGVSNEGGPRYGVMELGETHERARGMMRVAQQDYGRVYCDSLTMQLARQYVHCRYIKHVVKPELLLNIPLFEPNLIDPLEAVFAQPLNIKQAYRKFEADIGK